MKVACLIFPNFKIKSELKRRPDLSNRQILISGFNGNKEVVLDYTNNIKGISKGFLLKDVLLGAEKTLKNTACIHFPAIEIFYKKYGYIYKDVFDILKNHGFLIHKILSDGTVKLLDDNYHPKIGDYVAIRNLEQFLERIN